MQEKNKTDLSHEVFNELPRYINFYDQLAYGTFRFITQGTHAFCNIDSYVFSSVQGTVTSIKIVLEQGRINDAYALLRKYFDSVVINIYTNLYIQAKFSMKNLIVEQINRWIQGKEKLPPYRKMSQYIYSSNIVKTITKLIHKDTRYKEIRDRCNDHTHYNFYKYILLNDCDIYLPERKKHFDLFLTDFRNIFIMHIAYLFFINGHYMMSSDYLDSLDCGVTPDPDSQYWVAPFIQEIFDHPLSEVRPDIAIKIREHTDMYLAD
ncbi:hypothetical protein [Dethiosulfatarculus sandiegensis]|uniref:Uncharacterized protein n=1 Tax=Dethiosulfatarculus sandiegensis TaxID=1429043 RepID=A0A0D2J498_9BACT|nr:hypothetical protein [Dethiosulfatarculus sandiegensis]KIX12959.1 hypothetical protein X474_16145 [Dethiosulfatarculus sandiegensis]